MTVYEEVQKLRAKDFGIEGGTQREKIRTIRFHSGALLDGGGGMLTNRERLLSIAINAIAAIEALDAEKGMEAGNVE